MTTVGEFKKNLGDLHDSSQLEFWVVFDGRLVELTLNPSESVRFPSGHIAEIVLPLGTDASRSKKKKQRPKLARIF